MGRDVARGRDIDRQSRTMRSREPEDEGAALVEFIAMSLLLLVPLVYLILTMGRIQAGAFAAESAAAGAARAAVVEGVAQREAGASRAAAMDAAFNRAQAVLGMSAEDFGFDPDDAHLVMTCEGPCVEPGGNITAEVTVEVPLPGIPGFLGTAIPRHVTVAASARAPVDSVVTDS